MNIRVLISVFIASLVMLIVSSTPAAAQRHNCDDYCPSNDPICLGAWAEIHSDHREDGICSNHPTQSGQPLGPAALEGRCDMTWESLRRVLADTSIDCRGNTCTIVGTIPCGSGRKPYSLSCTESTPGGGGISDAPQASAGFDFARCQEFDGTTTYISCNHNTGNLATFHGSS